MVEANKHIFVKHLLGLMRLTNQCRFIEWMVFFSLVLCFSGGLLSASGTAGQSSAVPLLDRIALGEGTDDTMAQEMGYDSGYDVPFAYGKYGKPSKPLTEMNIGEVLKFQDGMIDNQVKAGIPGKKASGAVGRYQITRTTLGGLMKNLGLSPDTPFDAVTQEKMALALLDGRGYNEWLNGGISDDVFIKNLALEWASVADPNTGKSSYEGQNVGTTGKDIKVAMEQTKKIASGEPELGGTTPDVPVTVPATPPQIIKPVTLTLYVHEGSASGPIIPYAQVTGKDASGNSFQQTTDSDGYVIITGDSGTWSFSASADGYVTNNWDQDITETDRKDASLQKEQQTSESSVVGKWAVHGGTSECKITSNYHDEIVKNFADVFDFVIDFYNDGSFTDSYIEDGVTKTSSGEWVQYGNTIRLQNNPEPMNESPCPDCSEDYVIEVWQTEGTTGEATINGDTMSATESSIWHHKSYSKQYPENVYYSDIYCLDRWSASRVNTGS